MYQRLLQARTDQAQPRLYPEHGLAAVMATATAMAYNIFNYRGTKKFRSSLQSILTVACSLRWKVVIFFF